MDVGEALKAELELPNFLADDDDGRPSRWRNGSGREIDLARPADAGGRSRLSERDGRVGFAWTLRAAVLFEAIDSAGEGSRIGGRVIGLESSGERRDEGERAPMMDTAGRTRDGEEAEEEVWEGALAGVEDVVVVVVSKEASVVE